MSKGGCALWEFLPRGSFQPAQGPRMHLLRLIRGPASEATSTQNTGPTLQGGPGVTSPQPWAALLTARSHTR